MSFKGQPVAGALQERFGTPSELAGKKYEKAARAAQKAAEAASQAHEVMCARQNEHVAAQLFERCLDHVAPEAFTLRLDFLLAAFAVCHEKNLIFFNPHKPDRLLNTEDVTREGISADIKATGEALKDPSALASVLQELAAIKEEELPSRVPHTPYKKQAVADLCELARAIRAGGGVATFDFAAFRGKKAAEERAALQHHVETGFADFIRQNRPGDAKVWKTALALEPVRQHLEQREKALEALAVG